MRADLTDGSTDTADIVIGADGVHSTVRDIVFGAQQRYYRSLGYRTAGFVVWDYELVRQLGPDIKLMTAPGRVVGLCPLPGGRVAASFAYEAQGNGGARNALDELRNNYPEFGWLVPQVLNLAPRLEAMHHEQALQVDVPHWSLHRVVLLGDACHAGSALTGQEAFLAMSGAYVLVSALCREPTLRTAFECYENRMRPSLNRRQEIRRRLTKWLVPATEGQILVRNVALTLANQPWMGWLLGGLASSRLDGALADTRRS